MRSMEEDMPDVNRSSRYRFIHRNTDDKKQPIRRPLAQDQMIGNIVTNKAKTR